MTIGVIGAGLMGGAVVERLRGLGHAVAVCDIDPAACRRAEAAGAKVVESPAALAALGGCEAVIVAVIDGAQTHEVLFGPHGAAAALQPGSAVLLCPTISPQDVESACARLEALDLEAIDAPMSGGPARARDGTMSLMVACADAVWERRQPLLAQLASRLFRVGTRPGDGARTKLVNNLLAAVNLAGAAEALSLADVLGLDAAATLAVIEQSSGQSWIASDRARRVLAGDTAPRAHMRLLAKDSALALAAAAETGSGLPLTVSRQAAETFAAACRKGLADADDSGLWRGLG
jgi:L-threonate 2-dehydrogenase